ncbi:MAG: D-cysteine desulfhydrase family protein [Chloroflexota bacterium]
MSIEALLQEYPRITLTRTPTPLDNLKYLSQELGVNLYLKRDDLTDMTLGGDKPRKLEYEIARAQAQGADMLITCGSSQSNHARLTTASARRVGLDCAVVLSRDAYEAVQGNLLTVRLMGADIHIVDTENHWDLEAHVFRICDELRAAGRKPYYIPVSGTTPHSCLGYVKAGLETLTQLEAENIKLDAVYLPFGTGGIFAGMLYALRAKGVDCPFVGVSVNRPAGQCHENLAKWWEGIAELLPLDSMPDKGSFELYDDFIGLEYGDPTEACLDAIMKVGQTEGVLLDPVYSGKVMSGFLSHWENGRWASDASPNTNILILHSGGIPALFAYHEAIKNHLEKRDRLGD